MGKNLKEIEKELNVTIYVTKEGCELLNDVQYRIARERKVILDEKEILVPGCNIYFVKNDLIDAIATKIEDEYYICINHGVVEAQKNYLEKLDWSFITDETLREEYISELIEYGFYFFVFHEYAHIFCGHVDACLSNPEDKKAQECEADIFSMEYLVKYIIASENIENYTTELEKLFLAIYFLFENMQKERWEEWYNDKLMQNYYDPESVEKRKHPLSAQRMLYLYELLNVVVVTDEIEVLPVKDNIIEKLRILKRMTEKDIPNRDNDFKIVEESIQQLKESIKQIREKIPRIDNVFEA